MRQVMVHQPIGDGRPMCTSTRATLDFIAEIAHEHDFTV